MNPNYLKTIFQMFLILIFVIGLYVYASGNLDISTVVSEGMEEGGELCPDTLVNKGDRIIMFHSSTPDKTIEFKDIDEYSVYHYAKKAAGKDCPVLYLQLESNTQGEDVYRVRPSPFDQEGGTQPTVPIIDSTGHTDKTRPVNIIDASRMNAPFNQGNYPGFDPTGLYVGVYTNVDKVHESTEQVPVSDNPMDTNWGGVLFTQKAIQSGKYKDNEVTRPHYVTPKGTIQPGLYPGDKYPTA